MSPLGTDEEIEVLTRRLLHFFLSRKASFEDAWDGVQETLLRVLQTTEKGVDLGTVEGYSVGVAKKIVYEHYRKLLKARKHDSIHHDCEFTMFKHYDTPEQQVIDRDLGVRLHYGMSKLPTNMRLLLQERFINGVPTKIVAAKMGKAPANIDMRVHRAKQKLRKHINDEL